MQNDIFNNFYDRYNTKSAVPAWFGVMFRTALTKNITTDLWNELIKNTQMLASDSENTLQFVQELSNAFKDGSIAQELSILKNGTPVAIQKWFDNHFEWFPDVCNITYTSTTEGAEKISYDARVANGYPEGWLIEEGVDLTKALQDDDTTTVVLNPKYYETNEAISHSLVLTFDPKFVSKLLIYTKREEPINSTDAIAKYTVRYSDSVMSDDVTIWGDISGFISPQIVDINDTCGYISLTTKLNEASSEKLPIYEIDILGYEETGYYTFEFTNGDKVRVDTFNMRKSLDRISSLVTETAGYALRAEECAESAKGWAYKIINQAGVEGGYPPLNEDGKIPSEYISQYDVVNFIHISSESELKDVDAQTGDVAVLVQQKYDEDGNPVGEPTVTKSWLLLEIRPDNTRTWAVYGTSYATDAGHAYEADNANKANNALKINGLTVHGILSEDAWKDIPEQDRLGIYFVSIEGGSDD